MRIYLSKSVVWFLYNSSPPSCSHNHPYTYIFPLPFSLNTPFPHFLTSISSKHMPHPFTSPCLLPPALFPPPPLSFPFPPYRCFFPLPFSLNIPSPLPCSLHSPLNTCHIPPPLHISLCRPLSSPSSSSSSSIVLVSIPLSSLTIIM